MKSEFRNMLRNDKAPVVLQNFGTIRVSVLPITLILRSQQTPESQRWLGRADRETEHPDATFLFYRIAFKTADATEQDRGAPFYPVVQVWPGR
ncbi:hypothetical protein [Ruegeria sp. HKCCA0370]|uniref:hypothetical protein n=1 Tax=Ruegeria sp. HKCCA0370 TaxID=2682995 RepID=UPI001C2CA6EC|nr:hypothetical protein [Ruegeria sp. HKCCA0370]